jgi:hypothetical protein
MVINSIHTYPVNPIDSRRDYSGTTHGSIVSLHSWGMAYKSNR